MLNDEGQTLEFATGEKQMAHLQPHFYVRLILVIDVVEVVLVVVETWLQIAAMAWPCLHDYESVESVKTSMVDVVVTLVDWAASSHSVETFAVLVAVAAGIAVAAVVDIADFVVDDAVLVLWSTITMKDEVVHVQQCYYTRSRSR